MMRSEKSKDPSDMGQMEEEMNTRKKAFQIIAAFSLALILGLIGWRVLIINAADGEPIAPEPIDVETIEDIQEINDQESAVEDPSTNEEQASDPEPTADPDAEDLTPTAGSNMPDCEDVGITVATFIKDVTIDDGSTLEPGQYFTKVWRIQNVGTCTWKDGYQFVFASGDRMGGVLSQPLVSGHVPPGSTIDVSVQLRAPEESGSYRGYWRFQDSKGGDFGLTSGGSVWVDIKVQEGSSGDESSAEGYTGYPMIEILEVDGDHSVTIKTKNLPAQDKFNLIMHYYGTYGENGAIVDSILTGEGGNITATFQIPDYLKGQSAIAIRLESPYSGYYAYNWFINS